MEKKNFLITQSTLDGLKHQLSIITSKLADILDDRSVSRWISEDEVQAITGMCTKTLFKYRQEGVLPFSKIGRKIFYKCEDIDSFIATGYTNCNLADFITGKGRQITN